VVLTNLYVYHHRVTPASHPGILRHQINHAGEITLTHRQKIFAFEFAALNYINPGKNRYRYKLEGYDTEWVDAGHHQMASYTNINPGEYTFMVQGSNNNGVWNPEPRAVKVTVLPSFWQTWWFKVVALLFLAVSFIALVQWRFRSVRLQARLLRKMVDEKTVALQEKNRFIEEQNAELVRINEEISARNSAIGESNARLNAQNEQIIRQRDHLISLSEQLQQAHQTRISFFTAISHEFRTPLTLIIAPLRDLVTNLEETTPANSAGNSKSFTEAPPACSPSSTSFWISGKPTPGKWTSTSPGSNWSPLSGRWLFFSMTLPAVTRSPSPSFV